MKTALLDTLHRTGGYLSTGAVLKVGYRRGEVGGWGVRQAFAHGQFGTVDGHFGTDSLDGQLGF